MYRFQWILLAPVLAATPVSAQEMAAEQAFGARESVVAASLSPSGTHMAFLAPGDGRGNALYTVPVDGSSKPRRAITASGDPERLARCSWVSDLRLVCTVVVLRKEVGDVNGISRR